MTKEYFIKITDEIISNATKDVLINDYIFNLREIDRLSNILKDDYNHLYAAKDLEYCLNLDNAFETIFDYYFSTTEYNEIVRKKRLTTT